MNEYRQAMVEAARSGDSTAYYRAKAVAEFMEAAHTADMPSFFFDREFGDIKSAPGMGLRHPFDPSKHARGRHGTFIDMLKSLKSSPRHGIEGVTLPSGHTVTHRFGEYRVHAPVPPRPPVKIGEPSPKPVRMKRGRIVARGRTPEDIRRQLRLEPNRPEVQTPRLRVFDASRVTAKADPGTLAATALGAGGAALTTGWMAAAVRSHLRRPRSPRPTPPSFVLGQRVTSPGGSGQVASLPSDGRMHVQLDSGKRQVFAAYRVKPEAKADPGAMIDIAEKVVTGLALGAGGYWGSRGDPTKRNLKLKQKEEADIARRAAKAAAKADPGTRVPHVGNGFIVTDANHRPVRTHLVRHDEAQALVKSGEGSLVWPATHYSLTWASRFGESARWHVFPRTQSEIEAAVGSARPKVGGPGGPTHRQMNRAMDQARSQNRVVYLSADGKVVPSAAGAVYLIKPGGSVVSL